MSFFYANTSKCAQRCIAHIRQTRHASHLRASHTYRRVEAAHHFLPAPDSLYIKSSSVDCLKARRWWRVFDASSLACSCSQVVYKSPSAHSRDFRRRRQSVSITRIACATRVCRDVIQRQYICVQPSHCRCQYASACNSSKTLQNNAVKHFLS